eukprot:m.74976 g.74976  ORF g.74976 m.74976 type:complete len:263 (+) comp7790_c0_seq5:283-1071(+)
MMAETPCNPTMRLTDLTALGQLRLQHGKCITLVDSTVGSPINQQPLRIPGIDAVMHSCTKYLGGHSGQCHPGRSDYWPCLIPDIIAGCVSSTSTDFMRRLVLAHRMTGGMLSPFDAFLLGRGIKTLAVRMAHINAAAQAVATFLQGHPQIAAVHYPGLPTHPDHALALRQMSPGFSGLMSFELRGGYAAGRRFAERLRLARLAVSLGGAEALVVHPASTTHRAMPAAERIAAGIPDGLIRFSTGLEDAQDMIEALDEALLAF